MSRSPLRSTLPVYLCLVPAGLLLAAVFGAPLVGLLITSMQKSAGLAGTAGWIGLRNFQDVLQDRTFWRVAVQTVIWTVGVLVLTTGISLALALALRRRFAGRGLVRALLMVPWATAMSVSAVLWVYLLTPGGLIDRTLKSVGLGSWIQPWLANTPQATVVVILVGTWVSVPFTTLMLSAGLRSIPPELYEAASLDTDNGFVRDLRITIPLLRPVLAVTTASNAIVIFNSFPIIFIMTQGGPANRTHILATYLYSLAFRENDFGHAAAIAVLVSVVLVGATVLYARRAVLESDQGGRIPVGRAR